MGTTIRAAAAGDAEVLIGLHAEAEIDPEMVNPVRQAIRRDGCSMAEVDGRAVGYGMLEYTFFDNGFLKLLYVHPEHRRRCIGSELMEHLEQRCRTPKLFTSTNLSNQPMQSLLAGRGFTLSGFVENLDEGDPELIYFKRLG